MCTLMSFVNKQGNYSYLLFFMLELSFMHKIWVKNFLASKLGAFIFYILFYFNQKVYSRFTRLCIDVMIGSYINAIKVA